MEQSMNNKVETGLDSRSTRKRISKVLDDLVEAVEMKTEDKGVFMQNIYKLENSLIKMDGALKNVKETVIDFGKSYIQITEETSNIFDHLDNVLTKEIGIGLELKALLEEKTDEEKTKDSYGSQFNKEELKQIVELFNNQCSGQVTEIILDKRIRNGKNTIRSFSLNEDISSKFSEYCDSHRHIKQQDLLSQALLEFLDRYENA
jgi:hypothetical protein